MTADLNALSVFTLVAQERSFRSAADRLGVTRSPASQIIGRLQASLGVALMRRTTRSVSLTETGERLNAAPAPAIAEIHAAVAGSAILPGGRASLSPRLPSGFSPGRCWRASPLPIPTCRSTSR